MALPKLNKTKTKGSYFTNLKIMASLLIQIIIITACFTCIIPQNKQFMNICNVYFLTMTMTLDLTILKEGQRATAKLALFLLSAV